MEQPQQVEAAPVQRRSFRARLAALFAAGCWLYLVLALGAWALLRAADAWWPATFLMFSPRGLLVFPLALLLPIALALRRRCLAVLLLTGSIIAGPVMGLCLPLRLPLGRVQGQRLRLLTCNMHYHEQNIARLEQLVDEAQPDLVALQEWPLSARCEALEGADWHVERIRGLYLASRFPIRQVKLLGTDSMGEQGLVKRYVLETPAGAITLFNLHFATPRYDLHRVVHEQQRAAPDLDANSELRALQSAFVAGEANKEDGPVLLCGDFNTPPESVLFRHVWDRYTDAFGVAGWGWGYTFINNRTAVRIDHILAGPGWHCERAWVGPDVGSLHRPLLADLVWPARK